jgi:hypothetical protein
VSADETTAVLIARCENYDEEKDAPCPGLLRFRWGMSEAACDLCGGWCGVAVARWERVASAADEGMPIATRRMLDAENRELAALWEVDELSVMLRAMARRASDLRREARAEYVLRMNAEQNLRYAPLAGVIAFRKQMSEAWAARLPMPPIPEVVGGAKTADGHGAEYWHKRWLASVEREDIASNSLIAAHVDTTALRAQVSAVRALADEWDAVSEPAGESLRAVLDGSSETGKTPKLARPEPFESLRATSDDAADPYQRLADAIETSVLDSALIELTVTQDGRCLDHDAGLYVLARCLDKAGFIAADALQKGDQ